MPEIQHQFRYEVVGECTGLVAGQIVTAAVLAEQHPGLGGVDRLLEFGAIRPLGGVPVTGAAVGEPAVALRIDRLRHLMEACGFTIATLADVIGRRSTGSGRAVTAMSGIGVMPGTVLPESAHIIAPDVLNNLLAGNLAADVFIANKIATALGVSLDEITE